MEFSDCAENSNDLSLLIDPLYFLGLVKGGDPYGKADGLF